MSLPKVNRRNFLKATAMTGALVSTGINETLLSPYTANAQTAPQATIVKTACRNCTAECGILAHVRDNRVIKLEGNPEFERSEGALCAKGLAGIQALYHPNRMKYPMERAGARGENKWKRITWKEAIDKIAAKLMQVRKDYGAESVLCSTGGGGNPNFFAIARFCNTFGTPNWIEPGAAQCYMPRTLTYDFMYGGGFAGNSSLGDSNCIEAYFYNEIKMKTYVLWAAAPSYSGPAQSGRVMAELRARGVKTIVVDPRFTPDASKADIWLPIRPGTDVALQLAWIRYIIDKKLYDLDFVKRWTNLPYLVDPKTKLLMKQGEDFMVWDLKTKSAKPMAYPYDESLNPALEGTYKLSGVDVKPAFQHLKERADEWTLKKAADVCWLNAADIERAIKLYAQETPSNITLGVATDQNANSIQAAMGVAALDMLMGNIEKPGCVLQRFDESTPYTTWGEKDGPLRMSSRFELSHPLFKYLSPDQLKKRLGTIEHKGLLHWWTAHIPSVIDAMATGKPYPIKMWIERSGNKMGTIANTQALSAAMKNVDMIVHMYMYPTSFSQNADILLPLNEWLETDYLVSSFNRMFARQACTHLYETANEMWVWAQIVKRCGELGHETCKKSFDRNETFPELPYFNTFEEQLDAWCSFWGKTWKQFKADAPFENKPVSEWRQYYVYKQTDPKTGKPVGFGTPSKKCEVYAQSFIVLGRTGKPFSPIDLPPASKDYDALPYFIEPPEGPSSPVAKEFPLVMTNGRLPVWHHCTLRNIPYLREIFPVAEIMINPVDAKKYGVSQGDWVWVESPRGKINARALVTEGIAKGIVYMERFWNPETIDTPTQGWREMNVNVLTKNTPPFNDVCGTYTLRGFQVKVSKADGPPRGVWIKPTDFTPWMPQPSSPTPIAVLK